MDEGGVLQNGFGDHHALDVPGFSVGVVQGVDDHAARAPVTPPSSLAMVRSGAADTGMSTELLLSPGVFVLKLLLSWGWKCALIFEC